MLMSFHMIESIQPFGFVSLENAADLSVFLGVERWGYKIRAWYPLLLTFLFCIAVGLEPSFRWSFYPPQGFCSSNYWDPHGKNAHMLWEKSFMESCRAWCWEPASMLFEVRNAESLQSDEGNAWVEWRILIWETPQDGLLTETGKIPSKQGINLW